MFLYICQNIFSIEKYTEIKKKKNITIGISTGYKPLLFKNNDTQYDGFEFRLIEALEKYLEVDSKLVPLPLSQYITSIKNGSVDILIGGFSRSLSRSKDIWFSKPYLAINSGILINKNSIPLMQSGDDFENRNVHFIKDLVAINNFTAIIKQGSSYEELFRENYQNIKIYFAENNEEALKSLIKGEGDGFVHDDLYLNNYLYENPEMNHRYVLVTDKTHKEYICIGIPFGEIILKNQIDTFLDIIIAKGKIDEWNEIYINH